MGKNKNGLKREEDLQVIRGAGFKKHKRKQLDEISENTRAGLHKNSKNSDGGECVKRKKPLALKHKRRIKRAAVALSAVLIAALSLFGYGFFVGGGDNFVADSIFETSYFPTDSSVSPEEFMHTTHGYVDGEEEDDGWKTIGYLNYTLKNQPWYYSEMKGDIAINTPVGAMSQHVETEKQFYNNVLISSEATTTPVSLMGIKIEEATQFAVIADPKVVIWRKGASSDSSTFHGKDTPWSTSKPEGATWEEFRKTRGNLQTEFSVYVINRDTILSWTKITKNADGTYSQSFKLNHAQTPYENSAVYYYQKQMQASGGLPSLPVFSSVEVTYTFDAQWQVLRSQIKENYIASYGPIEANGSSSSVTEYSYDEEKAKNSFYDDYFKGYQSDFGTPAEKELTATDCLSSAFGSVLTGEAKLAVDLDLGGKTLGGTVHLNINSGDIRADLGNIKVYIMPGEGGQELYLSYGSNVKIKIPLSEVTGGGQEAAVSALDEGGQEAAGGFSTDDIMSDLLGGEFTVAEDKCSATLSSQLNLFGIKIPLTFNFNIDDGVASLENVETKISLLGADIGANLRFTEEDVPALAKGQASAYVPLNVSAITNLISAEALKADVSYENGGVKVEGVAQINLNELSVKADLGIVLDGDESAKKNISVIYCGEEVYLSACSAGEQPIKIKARAEELTGLITGLLGVEAGTAANASEILGKLLSAVEKIGLNKILTSLLIDGDFADKFAVSAENGFTLKVRGAELVEYFGGDFDLGDIELKVDDNVYLSVLGFSGGLESCGAFEFNADEYVSASDILPVINQILKLTDEKGLSFNGVVSLDIAGFDVNLDIELLSVKWDDGIKLDLAAKLIANGYSENVTASYNGETAALSLGEVGVTLNASEFTDFSGAIQALIAAATDSETGDAATGDTATGGADALLQIPYAKEIFALFDGAELSDVFAIVNALNISGENGNIALKLGDLKLTVINEAESDGILGVEAQWSGAGAALSVGNGHITGYAEPSAPGYQINYFNGAELKPLIEKITYILKDGGLNLNGGVVIDLKDNGNVQVELTNASISWKNGTEVTATLKVTYGELEKDIYVHYGKDGIRLYYDGVGVELKQDNINGFISAAAALYNEIAAEAGLPALEEATLQGVTEFIGMGSDNNGGNTVAGKVTDILGGLAIEKSKSGNLTLTYGDITAELVNRNGDLSATVKYKDISATINVGGYSEVKMPEAEYFNGAELVPLINNVTEILKDNGLTVSGGATIKTAAGDIGVDISALSVNWEKSLTFGLSATLTLDKTTHTIYAKYDGTTLSLAYDNVGVQLAQTEFTNFAAAAAALYNGIAKEAGLPALEEPTLQGVTELIGMGSDNNGGNTVAEKVTDILGGLAIEKSKSGNLTLTYGGVTAELVNGNGDLSATVKYKDISATINVGGYSEVKMPEAEYFNAAELVPLMEQVTAVIAQKGITVGGTADITVGSTKISVTVYGLSLNWANGIGFMLDARITVNGSDHDIYAEYSAESGRLAFVYGSLESGAGAEINVEEDAPKLEDALVKLYNRLAEVINTIVEEKPMKPAEDLNGAYEGLTPIINTISDLIKTLQNAFESVRDLTGKIESAKSEKLDIFSIINSFEYSKESKKFSMEISKINLSVWQDSLGFNLGVQTEGMAFELNGLTIIKTEPTLSFGIEPENLMTADDLCELTDYVAAAVEMLAKDAFKISLNGAVTTTDERYKDVDYVKYNVEANFEYIQGKEYPVHIETGADGGEPNLWVSPNMYARVTVNLKSTIIDVDSVLFDIYILDCNPQIDSNGLTAGALTTDDELDIYMSVSRIPAKLNDKDGANHSAPVKVYAPVSEIMTIAAAGVSMADLGSITTEYKEINEIIAKVADTLNVLLVDKYLTYTKEQFSSLGASLLEQILGGKVSDIITNLLKTLGGESAESGPAEEEPGRKEVEEQVEYGKYNRERKGALAKFAVTPTKDENGKTTNTTFEVQVKEGATASVTKENYPYTYSYTDADGAEQSEEREGTRITNVTVKNSKLNATDVIPELTVNVGYDGIEKPAGLTGYTSFVGVENLLQAIVSSATHSEEGENGATTYALNNNFYISGTLGVSALGLVNHEITIDGLSVSLDENNEIEVYLRLSYKGKLGLVNGGSTVDMAIKNGMVYLKRVQTTNSLNNQLKTPETIYRVMPIDTFMADIMHQIVFIFNFGDLIAKAMESSNPPIELNYKQDYGEQLADYFKSLILSENENGDMLWKITLHNTGINRLAGMSSLLSDGASVILHGEREEVKNESGDTLFNKYTIKSLDLSAALFKILKISGNLVWHNPCNVYDGGSEAAKNELESSAPSVKAEEWLNVSGAYTFNDIKANIEWDKLATSINGASAEPVNPEFSTDTESYLEVVFGGDENNYDNITSHARLGKYGYYLNEGGEERLLKEEVVWFTNENGELCSKNIADPDLSEYSKEHCNLVWGDAVKSGSTFKKVASYVAEKYGVTIHSEHEMPNFVWGDGDYIYQYTHTYGDSVNIDMYYEIRGNAEDKWYRIAYVECNGAQYYKDSISSLQLEADAEIYVVWEEIPHATVTVESEYEIADFENAGGKWQKTFEIETGKNINLKELVGEIADTAEGYTFGGFTLSEGGGETSDTINISGATTVYVKWIEPEITVNYYSSLNVADYAQTEKEGYTSAYTISKTYTLGGGFAAETPAAEGYIFLGWFYNGGETWIKVTNVKNDIRGSDKYSNAVELHALWYTYNMEDFTVKHTSTPSGWFSTTHTYDFDPVTVNAALYGNIGLLKELSFSDVNIYTIAKNNADYQTNTSHPWTGDAGKGTFEQNSNLVEEENRLEITATFDAYSYNPGGGKSNVVAVAEFAVMLGEDVITEHRQGYNEIKKEGTIIG